MSDQPTKSALEPEILEITLTRVEEPLRVRGAGGEILEYRIKEMTGTERDRYLNVMGSKVKTDANGKATGIRDFTGIMTALICRCLYGPDGKLVTEKEISEWPSSAQKKIFERCQAVNGLGDEKNVEAVKND